MEYSTLKQQIINDIKQSPIASTNAKALKQMIEDGSATYVDAAEYSKVLGDVVSKSITRNVAGEIAEEELGAFAEECLAPVYRSSQDTMLGACKNIQRVYNRQANLELNPVDVERDEDRILHIIERFKGDEPYDDLKFLINENVARSITRGAVQDSIRSNARFQSDAGLDITIARSDGSGCCDWCAGMVGTYDSFDKLPADFWGVHRGCSCVIDYRVGKTKNRISFVTDSGKISKVTKEI